MKVATKPNNEGEWKMVGGNKGGGKAKKKANRGTDVATIVLTVTFCRNKKRS